MYRFVLVVILCSSGPAYAKPIRLVQGQRQLFLDDAVLLKIDGLKRVLHPPQKRGAVLRSPNPKQTIQIRTTPIWDPQRKLYLLYVLSIDQKLWLSRDGLNWRPGPKINMGVRMVVRDPHDRDPQRRFKAALTNQGFAVSPDGVTWKKLPVPPVQSNDEANFTYHPQSRLFVHTVKRRGPYGRSVAVATSKDFRRWRDYGVVFHADKQDQVLGIQRIQARLKDPYLKQTEYNFPSTYSIQIYNMGVFYYEGLFIGLPSMYHHTGRVPKNWPGFKKMNLSPEIRRLVGTYGDYTGFYNVQVVCTRDFRKWHRVAKRARFIQTSPIRSGAYDIQTIIGPSAPVVRGDELWFYYTGIRQYAFVSSGSDPAYSDYFPDSGAVCLAVLRRDGFVSLDASDTTGRVTTKRLTSPGKQPFVNVALHKGGKLEVDLLNERGKVVATSEPITKGTTRGKVQWKVGKLAVGQNVQFRFRLVNGSLYSFWVQ